MSSQELIEGVRKFYYNKKKGCNSSEVKTIHCNMHIMAHNKALLILLSFICYTILQLTNHCRFVAFRKVSQEGTEKKFPFLLVNSIATRNE